MENLIGVTMGDYQGFYPAEWSGLQSQADLAKALDTGAYSTANSGGPLIGQSLENTVHVVTFDIQRHVPLFKKIVKQPAFATIEEYNRLLSYGEGGAFFPDGGLPRADDAQYERVAEKVKFMGALGEVTGPMMLAGRAKFGDILAMQVYNRTAFLLRKIEEAMFFADDRNDALSFRGMFQQIEQNAPENIIDLRGNTIQLGNLEDGAQMIADNYGFPTSMYMGVREKSSVSKLLYPVTRYLEPGIPSPVGIPAKTYASAHGEFDLVSDVWLRPGGSPKLVADNGAPQSPAGVSIAVEPASPNNLMATGTYFYAVSSVNSAGESFVTSGNAAAVITQNYVEQVSIVITNATSAKSYRVYRGSSANNLKLMKEVAAQQGQTTTIKDGNYDLPGTSKAVIMDESQIALKQLLPVRKVDLARVADSTRWMQIAYLTLILYAPRRFTLLKNIGTN